MAFVIRKAEMADAYNIATVHVLSWESAYRNIMPDDYLNNLSIDRRAENFKKNIVEHKEKAWFFVAENDGKIIGNICLGNSRDDDKPQAGEIIAIYLLEEFWGKGYGRKMMKYAVDMLKSRGYGDIILWVLEENDRARRFYEKCGFALDGSKKEIEIGKPLIEIRYALNLLKSL